jgi:Protein of unknown function (DUF402)
MTDYQPRFRPGDHVIIRSVVDGKVWSVAPSTVVQDEPDLVVFYTSPGMRWKKSSDATGAPLRLHREPWTLIDDVWVGGGRLRFWHPGDPYAVFLFWDEAWEFRAWYVNLEEPLRRTSLGFDTMDHTLDIVADRNRSWRWKDEDELVEAVRAGIYTQHQADQIRRDGEQAIAVLEANGSPYCDGWEDWRPDPSWTVPVLPPGWDSIHLKRR